MSLLFIQLLFLSLLILLSLADLIYRVAPAVEIFFVGCVVAAILYQNQNLIQVGAITLSVAYGAAMLPTAAMIPLVLLPLTWPSLLVGYGVRKELIGRGDLFAIGGISVMFSLDITVVAIIGMVLWSRWWGRKFRNKSFPTLIPLLPGMVIGMIVGIGLHLLLGNFRVV